MGVVLDYRGELWEENWQGFAHFPDLETIVWFLDLTNGHLGRILDRVAKGRKPPHPSENVLDFYLWEKTSFL